MIACPYCGNEIHRAITPEPKESGLYWASASPRGNWTPVYVLDDLSAVGFYGRHIELSEFSRWAKVEVME